MVTKRKNVKYRKGIVGALHGVMNLRILFIALALGFLLQMEIVGSIYATNLHIATALVLVSVILTVLDV